jgi:glycosyltransferase involved in cell wall biosynthesis
VQFLTREFAMTVTVVITTYNYARFLGDAISSVLNQTRRADEIIVIDDGSTDDPAAVVRGFAGVRLIRQENRGRSAARNVGLKTCTTRHLVFLDADDRLLPNAFETGLGWAATKPECAFVYGAHRWIAEDGEPESRVRFNEIGDDGHLTLLSDNTIGMLATVLFRRDCLVAEGGFDEGLHASEDYDLFLRLAWKYPISSYSAVVAEYRQHTRNTSGNAVTMLEGVLAVLDRHQARIGATEREQRALGLGRAHFRRHYTWKMLETARTLGLRPTSVALFVRAISNSPASVVRTTVHAGARFVARMLPPRILRRIEQLRGRSDRFPLGSVRFGDFNRLLPISPVFGFDRGTPIDRYYIERFLTQNAKDIRGHVLEAADNYYTFRFGGAQVERSDVINLEANPRATIVGDLTQSEILPEDTYDCILLTQTLHYLFDMRAGVATIHRALKPGGVLLVTMSGISAVDVGEWGSTSTWSVTIPVVRQLLRERFKPESVSVEAHGNILLATASLHGIAVEELDPAALDINDPRYPIVVVARAVKETCQ